MSQYNNGLRTFLLQGLSEPYYYDDLCINSEKIIGKNEFLNHFKQIVARFEK